MRLQIFGEGFLKIRDKFRRLKEKTLKTLKLTAEQLKALKERLKKWRPIKIDKVAEKGDSIEEVNGNSHVAEDLYQGDVVLTMTQAEEIAAGIEEQANGGNRTKRQAFKDRRYPNTLWSEGVNYYFHPLASREMRSAFLKGAKWWEKDTCINFAENRMAEDRIMADWLNQFNKETPQTNDNYGMTYDYERCDPRTSLECEMGGFPHPRGCRKCICPGGYGGARCTERVQICRVFNSERMLRQRLFSFSHQDAPKKIKLLPTG
ncbi:unnamed protein product [Haemonchus placei]|uniref:Astacin n=1 Tax=Haemonchus placei TaxID=6290 RepID=A0A0N4X4Q1_HAEPC|nr:unnamed protein product [Haemonchus placei]